MAEFKSAFFAFPNEPAELRNPITTAVELVKSNPSLSLQAWPQLPIFGAAIPDEVRGGIEGANVLVFDITKPNLNVYYETGCSSVVFLRNDVFELMVSETPDKGKAALVRIDWTDWVKLKQVIYLRLRASVVNKAKSFDDIWNRFFVDKVNGRDTFDYD